MVRDKKIRFVYRTQIYTIHPKHARVAGELGKVFNFRTLRKKKTTVLPSLQSLSRGSNPTLASRYIYSLKWAWLASLPIEIHFIESVVSKYEEGPYKGTKAESPLGEQGRIRNIENLQYTYDGRKNFSHYNHRSLRDSNPSSHAPTFRSTEDSGEHCKYFPVY